MRNVRPTTALGLVFGLTQSWVPGTVSAAADQALTDHPGTDRANRPVATGTTPKRPNILFFFADDLNVSIEGMGGHPDALTPNINRITRNGVQFLNAAANVPVCGPSRASIWSGLYPHTTGQFGHGAAWGGWRANEVLHDTVTLFEHFRDHGYHIYAAGKIQHNGQEDLSVYRNRDGSDGYAVPANFGPKIWDSKTLNARGQPVKVARASIQAGGTAHWDADFGPLMADPPIPGGTGPWIYIPAQGEGGFQGQNPGDHTLGGPGALAFTGRKNSDIVDGEIRPDAPPAQLYNLDDDPWQTTNVYPDHPDIVEELDQLLQTYRDQIPDTPRLGWINLAQ